MCPVAILDSGSGISTMSESVAAKLQAAVIDAPFVGPMTDDQYVKMADGKLVLVKQKSCPMTSALMGTSGDGSSLVSHEPLGFLSGSFRGSQQRWATGDKEGFAIVSTFRRLEHLLWRGVRNYTDNRNLAHIFEP